VIDSGHVLENKNLSVCLSVKERVGKSSLTSNRWADEVGDGVEEVNNSQS